MSIELVVKMAELLQRFSGNPFTTTVGQKIEQATDPSLDSENWGLNMEICDAINDTDEGPRDAVRAIKKRLQQNAGKNFSVVMFTLTVLEACVKNCGKRFHLLVTNKDFVQDLVKLIGPKNDPPAVVQEKVLSLIQSWAQAFRGQTELQGVVQVYNELKSKGIEFPSIESEAMPPIHTPQRSLSTTSQPQPLSQESVASSVPVTNLNNKAGPQASLQSYSKTVIPMTRRPIVTPMHLNAEQLVKLKSELDVVQANMKVFNEMLNELTPGKEHNDDWELLTDLNNTCQSMQTRIVELIEKVANEEVTNELLRVNDELNSLFLRYERHLKKHKPTNKSNECQPTQEQRVPQLQTQQTIPQQKPQPNEATLIDFTDDSTITVTNRLANIQMSGINATASKPIESSAGDLDFDIFAQSRSASNTDSACINDLNINKPDLYSTISKDKPNNDTQVGREQDFDEVEKWLKDEPSSMAGSEFERFLAERAVAIEKQPEKGSVVGQPKDKPNDNSLL